MNITNGTNGHTDPHAILSFRLPPQNLEAEMGVLGSVILDGPVMDDVAPVLTAGDFYRDRHQVVYREILALWLDGTPVDALTLADRLQTAGVLAEVGGIEFIAELVNSVPTAANAGYYASIVKQKAISRALVDAHNEGLREAYSNEFTASQLLDAAERRVFAIAEGEATGETTTAGAVVPAVMAAVGMRRAGEVTGLTSGLFDLDDVTTGFQPGNLIYLAGRTSMGKTSISMNIVDHVAVNTRTPVLVVSLEMNRNELVERLIVARSRVDGHKVRTGNNLTDAELARLRHAADDITAAPIFLDDTPTRTMVQITANARRLKARANIGLVVVDYVQLVDGEDRKDSRREQINVISKRLKALARELSVPVIALAQLNRGPENREGNRPRKSDLKECGGLEEDADVVLLLHRPEYYDPNDDPGAATVIVDKNRNGPTRDIKTVFLRNIMRFDNFAPHIAE